MCDRLRRREDGSASGVASTASRWLRHHPDAIDATRPAGSRGVVPNTVTFTEKRSPCRGRDVQDIVDAAPRHVDLWSDLMVKLDLWKAPDPERVRNRAAASTHAVHATLPLSEVVANWDELAEALGGSVFEDMLA